MVCGSGLPASSRALGLFVLAGDGFAKHPPGPSPPWVSPGTVRFGGMFVAQPWAGWSLGSWNASPCGSALSGEALSQLFAVSVWGRMSLQLIYVQQGTGRSFSKGSCTWLVHDNQ